MRASARALPGLDKGARLRNGAGAQVEAAGREILHRGRGAVRRHPRDMVGRKSHRLQPADQREMPDAALAGAGGFHLAGGRRLDGVGKFLHGLVGRGCVHGDARRVFVHQRERGVALRVEFGEALPVHHGDFHRDHADRVAIGCAGRDARMPDHAGAAGAVHDVERLAEVLFEQRCDDARRRVGAAARAPGHDHGDRAGPDSLARARASESRGRRLLLLLLLMPRTCGGSVWS